MYDNSIICDMCIQEQVQPGGKYEIHKWVDLMNHLYANGQIMIVIYSL